MWTYQSNIFPKIKINAVHKVKEAYIWDLFLFIYLYFICDTFIFIYFPPKLK